MAIKWLETKQKQQVGGKTRKGTHKRTGILLYAKYQKLEKKICLPTGWTLLVMLAEYG